MSGELLSEGLRLFAAADLAGAARAWLRARQEDPDNPQIEAYLRHIQTLDPESYDEVQAEFSQPEPPAPLPGMEKTSASDPTAAPAPPEGRLAVPRPGAPAGPVATAIDASAPAAASQEAAPSRQTAGDTVPPPAKTPNGESAGSPEPTTTTPPVPAPTATPPMAAPPPEPPAAEPSEAAPHYTSPSAMIEIIPDGLPPPVVAGADPEPPAQPDGQVAQPPAPTGEPSADQPAADSSARSLPTDLPIPYRGENEGTTMAYEMDLEPELPPLEPGAPGPDPHAIRPPPTPLEDPWDSPAMREAPPVTVDSKGPGLALVEPTASEEPELRREVAPTEMARLEGRLKELFDLDDFTGAAAVAAKILDIFPNHPIAAETAEACRDTLMAMYRSKLGDPNAVPVLLKSPEDLIWLDLDQRSGFVLSQIDGVCSYEEVVEVAGMERLESYRILAKLAQDGVIGPE